MHKWNMRWSKTTRRCHSRTPRLRWTRIHNSSPRGRRWPTKHLPRNNNPGSRQKRKTTKGAHEVAPTLKRVQEREIHKKTEDCARVNVNLKLLKKDH